MSDYHTKALKDADIFTIMGSIYSEVARYDSSILAGHREQADQAITRAKEIIDFSHSSNKINIAQKMEIKIFDSLLDDIVKRGKKSNLDSYLMPFAVAARIRQFS